MAFSVINNSEKYRKISLYLYVASKNEISKNSAELIWKTPQIFTERYESKLK